MQPGGKEFILNQKLLSRIYSVRWLTLTASIGLGLAGALGLVGGIGYLAPTRVAAAAPQAIITVNVTTDELNGDGDCSLREAIQAANTDAVVSGCTAGSGADIIVIPAGEYVLSLSGTNEDNNTTGDLDIASSITLQGADAATTIINANNIDRALHALSTAALTVQNVTIQRGNVVGNGGGILTEGDLNLQTSVLLSNTASNQGGGVFVSGAGTFVDTNFITNTSSANSGGGAYVASLATVTGGRFERNAAPNTSTGRGGGLFANAQVILTNVEFYTNVVGTTGAGLYVNGVARVDASRFQANLASGCPAICAASNVFLTNTQFLTNTASTNTGGAVRADLDAFVTGGLFQNNSTTANAGALAVGNRLFLSGTTFFSNTATLQGGGVYVLGEAVITNATFINNRSVTQQGGGGFMIGLTTLNGGTFDRNTALNINNGFGGGVYVDGLLNATGVLFTGNVAGVRGGGALAESVVLNGGQFEQNQALGAASGAGGGVYVTTTVDLTGTAFYTNLATMQGGGVYVGNDAEFTNPIFAGNSVTNQQGGGAYVLGAATLTGGWFERNTALNTTNGRGAGLYVLGPVVMANATFSGNIASLQGGGLFATSTATLNNMTFITNTSQTSVGGGAYVVGDVTVVGSTFMANRAPINSGGGLYANNLLILTDSVFTSNSTGAQGGGVYAASTAQVTNGTFSQNLAPNTTVGRGAGIYVNNFLTITGTLFAGNAAGDRGGGLYVVSPTVLTNISFVTNTAATQGGGVYLGSTAAVNNVWFERNMVTNTTTGLGGGLYGAGTLNLWDSEFYTNTAGNRGGGFFANAGAYVTNTIFISNAAQTGGGGGSYVVGALELLGGSFERNTALNAGAGSGAGLYAQGVLNLDSTTFYTNTAGYQGGGLYALTTTLVSNATFNNNVAIAHAGGGTYLAANGTVTNTTYTANTALNGVNGSGGGIHGNSVLTLTNLSFQNNMAALRGGGVYAAGAAQVSNSWFTQNTITSTANSTGGGGLYANAVLTLTDSNFYTNAVVINGGGLYANNLARVTNTIFNGNTAQNPSNGLGGGLYAANTLTLTTSSFTANSAGSRGGGAYLFATGTFSDVSFWANITQLTGGGAHINGVGTVNDSWFERNVVTSTTAGLGGGLYANLSITVTDTSFYSNVTGYRGGGLFANSAAAHLTFLTNTTFVSNTAQTNSGGGTYVLGALNIADSWFERNTAPNLTAAGLGGGAFASVLVTVSNTSFYTNFAGWQGGGLFANSSALLTNLTSISNTAQNNQGGAVYVAGAATVNGGWFERNAAPSANVNAGRGGGLGVNGNINLSGTTFILNYAGYQGGALYGGGTSYLTNTTILTNTAQNHSGGGGYFVGLIHLNGGRVENNTALQVTNGNGGGLYTASALTLTNVSLANNTASVRGGGAFASNVWLFSTQVLSNTAGDRGGGVMVNTSANIADSAFQNNSVPGLGGGLYALSGGIINITNTQFFSNSGNLGGGGVALDTNTVLGNFNNVQFISNTSASGGGLQSNAVNLSVVGGLFQNNRATGTGGGLYAFNAFALTGTQFINNAANIGAGLYHTNNTGRVVNALFARNSSVNAGAALYLNSSGAVTVLHTTIASPTLASRSAIYVANGTVGITNTIIASHAIGIDRSGGTVRENYNLFFENTSPWVGIIITGANTIHCGAPAFVNPPMDDYHLSPASGAIDVGLFVSVTTDYENEVRPQMAAVDIGFDESPYAPTPLTGLAATNSSPTLLSNPTTFTPTITGGSGVCYQYNFGDGTPVVSSGSATLNRVYPAAGTYTALITATNSLNSISTSTPVTILANAPITGLVAANSSPNLRNTPTWFTATIGGGTSVTYTWNFGNGVTSTGNITSYVYLVAGSYTAIVTATNTTNSMVATTTVVILPDTAISGLTAANSSPSNQNSPTWFTASVSAGTNVSYTWNFGDGFMGTGITAVHTYTTPNIYTAIVTATNSANTQSVTTSVTVVANAPISGLAANSSSPTYIGSPTWLTATVTAGSNIAYTWDFGDGTTGSGASTTHTYAALGVYTAVVTATNNFNTMVATTTVSVANAPVSGLTAANSGPNSPNTVTWLTATIAGGTNVTYAWSFGDGGTAVGANVTHTYATAGVYTAVVTATNSLNTMIANTVVTVRSGNIYLPYIRKNSLAPQRAPHGTRGMEWQVAPPTQSFKVAQPQLGQPPAAGPTVSFTPGVQFRR